MFVVFFRGLIFLWWGGGLSFRMLVSSMFKKNIGFLYVGVSFHLRVVLVSF